MFLEHSNLLLLDTNMLSPEKLVEHGLLGESTLVAASTSAQKVLGMQRPDREGGYRYALPMMNDRLLLRANLAPDQFFRWASDHAKHRPVSRHTDSLVVPVSRLRHESRELGHAAVAIAHETGDDRLFRAYAARGLRTKQLRRVLSKWEFLRAELEAIIPLDDAIALQAVALANAFVDSGQHVKGTARNSMNDMYVAATSLVTGIPLVTADAQLNDFYREHGWTVPSNDGLYIALPSAPSDAGSSDPASTQRGDRYINRPLSLRSHVDQVPPPGR